MKLRALLIAIAALALSFATHAEDGMYLLQNLPRERWAAEYKVQITDNLVDSWLRGTVKVVGAHGCSAAFVSSNGIVRTNHHCVGNEVDALGLLDSGFYARVQSEQKKLAGMELRNLQAVVDVSDAIHAATKNLTGEAFTNAERNAMTDAVNSQAICKDQAHVFCEVKEHFNRRLYHLYAYNRWTDVRLVFAPEAASPRFGGNFENFRLRPALDVAFLQVWPDGKPARSTPFIPGSVDGVKEGDTTIILGHPGSTRRTFTAAQAKYHGDVIVPWNLERFGEWRGLLYAFGLQSSERRALIAEELFVGDNYLLVYQGRMATLGSEEFTIRKQSEEQALRKAVAASSDAGKYSSAWDKITEANAKRHELWAIYALIEGWPGAGGYSTDAYGFWSNKFQLARFIVRWSEERQKPDKERKLQEYREAAVADIKNRIDADTRINDDLEVAKLSLSLSMILQQLGSDHPVCMQVFGKETPEQVAKRVVTSSKLQDKAYRQQMWERGIEGSTDPMILLTKAVDPAAREIRRLMDDEIEGTISVSTALIDEARKKYGTGSDAPDATFTLRANIGRVAGFIENGRQIKPFTTFGDAFALAKDGEPYKLPDSWVKAKDKIDMSIPVCFAADNDIIGGNSGSPVINDKGHDVGIAYDGNRASIGNAYAFNNGMRMIVVDARGIDHALRIIYNAANLADQIGK